jgi:predicted transcriptional regulator
LKRHLQLLGLTPETYRAKWGLPHDYPMVSPNYKKLRSETALRLGLGRKTKAQAAPAKSEPTKSKRTTNKAAVAVE